MTKNIVCIVCPRGCNMTVEVNGSDATVKGNACIRGEQYGKDECICPMRTVTSIIRVDNREDTMVSVKTKTPVKKEDIFKVMEKIRGISVSAPIKIGDVLMADLFGSDIIATKSID